MQENGKRKGSAMNIEIAQRLYELRRKHGFSQESLAAELGLSRQAVSKWERSESAPDMGNLIALADLYGMTIDELIRPAVAEDAEFEPEAHSAENAESVESAESAEETAETAVKSTVGAEVAESKVMSAAAGVSTSADPLPSEPDLRQSQSEPMEQDSRQAQASQEDVKQFCAHGHIYSRSAAEVRPRCALRRFPYPLLVVVLFVVLALVLGLWEYVWLFLTIPFYYWIARVIERDPVFLEQHGYAVEKEVL